MNGGGLDFEKPILELERKISDLRKFSAEEGIDVSEEIKGLQVKLKKIKDEVFSGLSASQRVQIARHPKRPYFLDYVERIFSSFLELHGDRRFSDDKALVGGLAEVDDVKIMAIGHQKGRDTKENLMRNFGCAHPEGYRKALRLMKVAEKMQIPIVSFIDTPGAYPGIGAEERGQAEAIAVNLREMSLMKVPIVCVIIGEGGSGGALGIGVGDRILILQNAYYSVISPEGCAAILWKDRAKAKVAANALKLTADDLIKLGIVDEIVKEPSGGAHRDSDEVADNLKKALVKNLKELQKVPVPTLIQSRYNKFRNMGAYEGKKNGSKNKKSKNQ
ncbi:MAG: acetyl-CoA carboxylase carboxyltransferase subunit alpha [Candidatus Aureabacteria bacterium]|nr:acetyl-CoA carboxylase carboxyltransferase subunit alpha [Candidatus Auribacterota bacterium]